MILGHPFIFAYSPSPTLTTPGSKISFIFVWSNDLIVNHIKCELFKSFDKQIYHFVFKCFKIRQLQINIMCQTLLVNYSSTKTVPENVASHVI